ncbi:MAG TPA: DUF680 domain-containing protein [Mesorhizobium sp.]|jgi:hypothetical protein
MKTIALTAAALLVAAGSAFAASDHFKAPSAQSNQSSTIDNSYTASVRTSDATVQKPVTEGNTNITAGSH